MDMLSPTSVPQPNTSELLPGLRAGEEQAFEAFVRRFCDPMFYVAKRILRNDEDAREAMQEAFLSAFRGLANFAGQAELSTWLHRIVINAALRKLRSRDQAAEQSIERLLPHFTDDEHHQQAPQQGETSVEALLQRKEMQSLVRQQIDQLPDSYRTVVLLRDIEGLNTEETAAMLGITTLLVKTRLHRARQALRTLLEPYFKGEWR